MLILEHYESSKRLIEMKKKLQVTLILSTFLAMVSNFIVAAYAQAQGSPEVGYALIGAGLAIGLAGLGAGTGMGTAGAAAIGALAEKPEVFSKTLIYIVFIEAIAIYGLVIAFMILMKI